LATLALMSSRRAPAMENNNANASARLRAPALG
jgi:hypothetical protein